MRRTFALIIALTLCAASQEKSAAAWHGEGTKLEAEGRVSATTLAQLTIEVAKLDARLKEIDDRRKQLEADSEKSEDSKDRIAPQLKDLESKRGPLEAQKARIEQERTKIIDRRSLERALEAYRKSVERAGDDKAMLAKALLGVARVSEISIPDNVPDAQAAYARIVAECADQKAAVAEAERKIRLKGVDVYLDQYARFVADWRELLRNSSAPLEEKRRDL